MLDSERKFKIKIRWGWTIFEILLLFAFKLEQSFAFKEFCMKKKIFQYLQNCKRQEVDHDILESSYRWVQQVTSEWNALKNLFLRSVEILAYFYIQSSITFCYFNFGKSCKTTLFRKTAEVSQSTPTFISIEVPITK